MRTITIDLDTGRWVDPKPAITGEEGRRVAAAVLPGMPEEEIERAYGFWMTSDGVSEERIEQANAFREWAAQAYHSGLAPEHEVRFGYEHSGDSAIVPVDLHMHELIIAIGRQKYAIQMLRDGRIQISGVGSGPNTLRVTPNSSNRLTIDHAE